MTAQPIKNARKRNGEFFKSHLASALCMSFCRSRQFDLSVDRVYMWLALVEDHMFQLERRNGSRPTDRGESEGQKQAVRIDRHRTVYDYSQQAWHARVCYHT